MHLIAYTSEYTGNDLKSDLKQIVAAAKTNNLTTNVTGVMFSHNHRFLQFIEGQEASVRGLMARIQQDSRHQNIVVLFDEPIPDRGFGNWNMDHFDVEPGQPVEVESLELIRDACRKNFKTRTETLVGIYRGFIETGV